MDQATVLIVDDEQSLRETMEDLLENQGYKVFSAENGVTGLRLCAENNVDLIVLDIMMPRMDGYMFMERLTERWENENRNFNLPKILVMSAVDHKTDMGLAKNLGANQFLSKPFRPKEFVKVIKELLES